MAAGGAQLPGGASPRAASTRALVVAALALFLVNEADAFAPAPAGFRLGAALGRTASVAQRAPMPGAGTPGRSLPIPRMSSEPGWDEESGGDAAGSGGAGAVGQPGAGVSSGAAGAGMDGSASAGVGAELKPSLQELAQRARDEAAARMAGSTQSTSRSATWKESLARRMQEASQSDAFSLPLPGFSMESVGLKGNWRECGGSFVLDPPVPPIGVVHFVGGAFVGAAPHLAYRFFLELLSDEGFVVVATPYRLTFNYLNVCAEIEARSKEALEESVANGNLPIISVGHSAGSLLHVISSCLFAGEKRAAAVLISYNNMQAKDSIPQLEEVVSPASEFLVREGDPVKQAFLGLRTRAEDLTTELAASGIAPRSFGTEFLSLAADGFEIRNPVQIVCRVEKNTFCIETARTKFMQSIVDVRSVGDFSNRKEGSDTLQEILMVYAQVVEQVPGLLEDIAGGRKEFFPEGDEIKELIKTSYQIPSTLVVGFEKDGFDESATLKGLLGEAGVDFETSTLAGNHGTPLIPDPLVSTPFDSFDPLLPLRRQIRQKIIEQLWGLTKVVTPFLQKSV